MAAISRIHSAITIDLNHHGAKTYTYCCSLCKQFRGKSYKRVLSHIGMIVFNNGSVLMHCTGEIVTSYIRQCNVTTYNILICYFMLGTWW